MFDIDLNCDLGEGMTTDKEIIPFITSANIACGFHAGNPQIASQTITFAKKHRVMIGAHPAHPDREHFGRRELARTAQEVLEDCLYQIGGLSALAKVHGTEVRYIKAHGGLYHQVCKQEVYAQVLIEVAQLWNLALIGLPGSHLEKLSHGKCPFFAEGFADRRYLPDGNLVPRTEPDAFIHDPHEAIEQMKILIREKGIRTICVHGDNPRALMFVRTLRDALLQKGFRLKAFV